MSQIPTNSLIDLVAAWGSAAMLLDLWRHGSPSSVTLKSRLLFGNLFFFFVLRAALLIWPSTLLDLLAYLPAAILPLSELVFVEGLLGKSAPRWLGRTIIVGSIVFVGLNVAGLRLGNPPVETAFTVFALCTLAACAFLLLARDRSRLSVVENRFIDAVSAACGVAIPLASTDFIPSLPGNMRLGGVAALLMAHTLSRLQGRSDSLGTLAAETASLALKSFVAALFIQVALGDLAVLPVAKMTVLALAFMLLYTMLGHHRILVMRQRDDSFIKWCLRLQTTVVGEFVEALRDFPLTRGHKVLKLDELTGFDKSLIKARLGGELGLASLDSLLDEAARGGAEAAPAAETARLLNASGMSHAFRVHGELGLYMLFKGVAIGGDGYQRQKLELVQRMARSLEAHDLLRRRDEALRQAQKMEALGRLAAGISHEFGNLLMVIKGFAQAVQRSLAPGHAAIEDSAEIMKAAERASGVVKQLMAFSRRQVLQRESLDWTGLLMDSETMLARLLQQSHRLEIKLPGRAVKVMADRTQLDQVAMNLVINARDAMPQGGLIRLALTADASIATLIVSDTGHGMDEATRQRIFEPFFTTKELGKGTGLGLATVLGIVEQSGGTVLVRSSPGQGSEFEIRLPVLAPETPPTAPGICLVVDDEPAIRILVRRALEGRGWQIREAGDGIEGLRQAQSAPMDLLVVDGRMPGMSGDDLLQALSVDPPAFKILMISSDSSAFPGHAEKKRGHRFLAKPFDEDQLLSALNEVMSE